MNYTDLKSWLSCFVLVTSFDLHNTPIFVIVIQSVTQIIAKYGNYFLVSSDHSFCNSFSHEICSMKNARISYSFLLISQGANLWHSTPTYFVSITNPAADKEAIILARKAIPIHIMKIYFQRFNRYEESTNIWKVIDSENKVKATNKQNILPNFF